MNLQKPEGQWQRANDRFEVGTGNASCAHRWVGDVCGECRMSFTAYQREEIARLEMELAYAKRAIVVLGCGHVHLLGMKDCETCRVVAWAKGEERE